MSGENYVPYPPGDLVIALQYWQGDELKAMRLARLLADIEPKKRTDVALVFCRRYDCPASMEAAETLIHCARKFKVASLQSQREGTGHPDGSNALMAGTLDQLAEGWALGDLTAASVFLAEWDGVPLCRDWLDRLMADHQAALLAGRRVAGAFTGVTRPVSVPHVNGSLIMHLSCWLDHPSMHRTPPGEAWDLFHSVVLMGECQRTELIKNVYGGKNWSAEALASMGRETAWLSNTKDESAISWAERELTKPLPPRVLAPCRKCGLSSEVCVDCHTHHHARCGHVVLP